MTESPIWTVLVTAITVLGSASAWRYWEKRAMKKDRDEDFMRHDCRDRISKLEVLLTESSREKDEMRELILSLTEKVAALSVKVEYLQRENHELQNRIVN